MQCFVRFLCKGLFVKHLVAQVTCRLSSPSFARALQPHAVWNVSKKLPFMNSATRLAQPRMSAFCLPVMMTAVSRSTSTSEKTKPMVFVAGATGNVGRRVVKKLAEAGCRVRAGSRDPVKCREKVGDLADLEDRVDYIPFDVTDRAKLSATIGESEVVVSTLGAPFSWGRVDGFGIADLMKASAEKERVKQLIVVSSIGVGRPWTFPAGLLNLFGCVLLFKDYSEHLTRSVARKNGKMYLIIRPGGMERPTDAFYLTHNLRLSPRNTLAGGLVSSMQIAELIATAILNPAAADGKTVEAVAEIDAPKLDMKTLLEKATAE